MRPATPTAQPERRRTRRTADGRRSPGSRTAADPNRSPNEGRAPRRRSRARHPTSSSLPFEGGTNLVVAHLVERLVPFADGEEDRGRLQEEGVVADGRDAIGRVGRRDGRREGHAGGAVLPPPR